MPQNLDFIEGSCRNSQASSGPRLIMLPTSVGDKAKTYRRRLTRSKLDIE